MMNFAEIDQAIRAVCPIQGVSFGDRNDKSTWLVVYAEDATDEQRKAADDLLAKQVLREVPPPRDPIESRLSMLEEKIQVLEGK